ncbi:MAG: hypothetical protein K5673_01540 [Lachnospiraceae bacterium]|nr:hypothetical protein [Lachnospiraceae bacterium]
MSIIPLVVDDYIMVAELLGLWVMLRSNVHLDKKTIKITRMVIIMMGIIDMAEFVKKNRVLFYLPLIISAPLLYTSQWTHLFYWFDENNLYIAAGL